MNKKTELKNTIKQLIKEILSEQSYKVGGRSYRTFQDSPQVTQNHDPEVTENGNYEEADELQIIKNMASIVEKVKTKTDNHFELVKAIKQIEELVDSLLDLHKSLPMFKSGEVAEVAPPGWEKTVKGMKKHKGDIENPWALAWSMKNKGDKPSKS